MSIFEGNSIKISPSAVLNPKVRIISTDDR